MSCCFRSLCFMEACGFESAECGAGATGPGFVLASCSLCVFYSLCRRASGTAEHRLSWVHRCGAASVRTTWCSGWREMFVGCTTSTEARFWNIKTFFSCQFFEVSSIDKSTHFFLFFLLTDLFSCLCLPDIWNALELSGHDRTQMTVCKIDISSQVCSQLHVLTLFQKSAGYDLVCKSKTPILPWRIVLFQSLLTNLHYF